MVLNVDIWGVLFGILDENVPNWLCIEFELVRYSKYFRTFCGLIMEFLNVYNK